MKRYLCNYIANWLEGDSDDDDDYYGYDSWKKVCMISILYAYKFCQGIPYIFLFCSEMFRSLTS